MKCLECNKFYHICSSCDEGEIWTENDFCSEECMLSSNKLIKIQKKTTAFIDSLTEKTRKEFEQLLNNYINYHEYIFEDKRYFDMFFI